MPAADTSTARATSGYLESEPHYRSVAGRILTALRGEASLVLVTSDPPPRTQPLAQALHKLAGSHHKVIAIPCGPELTVEEVFRTGSIVATLPAIGGTVAISDTAETDASLFVFAEADRLSDQQLREICTEIRRCARLQLGGVLLARQGFLARLEQPSLQFPGVAPTARLRFDEVGDEEGIDFLRHQLAARHADDEARRTRPVLFRGLAALGVLAAIGAGASLAVHYAKIPSVERTVPSGGNPSQSSTAPGAPPSTAALPPAPEPPKLQAAPGAPTPDPAQSQHIQKPNTSIDTPAILRDAEISRAPARSEPPPSGQHLSATDIAALVIRGDKFLSAGDIVSARSFYERAADAGDAAAALRLGATFDPDFLDRAGVRGTPGDRAMAASWYRRARDLGDAAAGERLKNLNQEPR